MHGSAAMLRKFQHKKKVRREQERHSQLLTQVADVLPSETVAQYLSAAWPHDLAEGCSDVKSIGSLLGESGRTVVRRQAIVACLAQQVQSEHLQAVFSRLKDTCAGTHGFVVIKRIWDETGLRFGCLGAEKSMSTGNSLCKTVVCQTLQQQCWLRWRDADGNSQGETIPLPLCLLPDQSATTLFDALQVCGSVPSHYFQRVDSENQIRHQHA